MAKKYSPDDIEAFAEARQNLVGDNSMVSLLHLALIYEEFDGSGVRADSMETRINDAKSEEETIEDTIIRLAEAASKNRSVDGTISYLLKCPECGGALVKRTATRGPLAGREFFGCSNFPGCKYIKE